MVICGTALPAWIDAKYHHTHEDTIGIAIVCWVSGLIASSVLSFGLGSRLARGEISWFRRIERAMGYGIIIEIVSLVISYPGCAIVGKMSR